MEQGHEGCGAEVLSCDCCGQEEAQGAFFVPGKGVLNLCGHCRVFLMAILIDLV